MPAQKESDPELEAMLVRIVCSCYQDEIQKLIEVANPAGQFGMINVPVLAKLTTDTIAQHKR